MSSQLIIWCKSFGFFGFFDIIALVSNAFFEETGASTAHDSGPF